MATSKPDIQPPDENRLRVLLANGMQDVVEGLILSQKLPYTIALEGDKYVLKDALKGTELYLKKFITVDPETEQMKSDVPKMAKSSHEVLIHGETGTGKETIARAMIGEREGSTIFINCGGLPDTLIESELFGYVQGAFTGATGNRQGLLAAAKNGLAFLDEIGELPLASQAKLLRAIQEKRIRRVGGTNEEEINCKIVCATNKDLKKMVKEGQFRQDLFARISTLELSIKPIRNRMCDIEPIILSLVGGKEFLSALTNQGKHISMLNTEHNVRSLQQAVTRFQVLGRIVL